MTSVLSLILHYQKYIEKCPNDEKRVLRCIDKLHQLGVTVQHLQETGVGRTINALRKEQGDVGKAARALVTKWKLMVAAEEDSSDPEDAQQAPESPQDSGRESDDNDEPQLDAMKEEQEQCYSYDEKASQHYEDHSRKRPSEHERPSEENKRSKREHSSSDCNDYEERKHSSYADHSENDNDGDIENSDQANYEQQSNYNDANASSNLQDKRHTDRLNRHKTHRHSEERRDHSSQKSKLQTKDDCNEQPISQSTSGSHHKSSRSDKHKDSESKKHSSESTKHSSELTKQHHSKDRHTEKREDRDKSASASESAKISLSDKHRQSRDKEKEKSSSKSRSKESSTEKHKKSSHDKEKGRDDSSSGSREKFKEKSRDDSTSVSREKFKEKSRHSQNGDSNSKSHTSDTGSHSGKEHSSKSRHESKKQSSHEANESNSRSKERSYDKSASKNRESKSSKSSSSNDCDVRTVSNKEVSEKPKKDKKVKISTPASEDSEDGIDCESGASFAEALGMASPSKSKKKPSCQKDSARLSPVADMTKNTKSKTSSSNAPAGNSSSTLTNDVQIASLLAPTAKLAPLPAIEITALPEISTNYKPRPPPKLMASLNSEEEALRSVMSNKNQRTKVYSGNKIYGALPSLYELCVVVLQEHIDALEYTGGVPYEILKPVVDRATPDQLFTLEHYNPYLMEDTNHLWQKHCEKCFRTKKRLEMETWREMYMRCQDEQDEKLKSLTANIKMSQEVKNAPTRQTKMAYVDSVVKPPRGIARKQAIHGTARAPVVSPAARVASLATGNVVKPESARPLPMSSGPPMRSSTSFVKPKKAPLMQKALQFMKGRIKR